MRVVGEPDEPDGCFDLPGGTFGELAWEVR
jgi:hypothetical protein